MNLTMWQRSALVFTFVVIVLSAFLIVAQASPDTIPSPIKSVDHPLDGTKTLVVDRAIRQANNDPNKGVEQAYLHKSFAPMTGVMSRARRHENDMRLFGRRHRLKRLDSDLTLKEHDRDREKRQYMAYAPASPFGLCPAILCVG